MLELHVLEHILHFRLQRFPSSRSIQDGPAGTRKSLAMPLDYKSAMVSPRGFPYPNFSQPGFNSFLRLGGVVRSCK